MQYEKCLEDYDASRTLSTYESFLETFGVRASLRDVTEPVWTKLAITYLYYAEALALADEIVESQNQLEVARELLSKGYAISQQPVMHMPPTAQLWMSKIRAKSSVPSTPTKRKTVSLKCADEAKAMQDWPIYREHIRDALLQSWEAKEIGDLETRVEEVKDYFRILAAYTEFEDGIIHSALHLSHAIWRYGVATHQQESNLLEHYLDIVKTHEQNFPDFSVPLIISYRARTTAVVAKRLGDDAMSKHYYAVEGRWNDRCPWMVKLSGEYILKDDLPDQLSHRRWHYDHEDPKRRKIAKVAARLIVRWVKREMHENDLSKAEVEILLQWDRLREAFLRDDCSFPHDLELDALPSTAPDKLCDILFSPENLIGSDIWDPWFSNLEIWLKRDRLPSRLQRLTLLKETQGLRCYNVFDFARRIRPFPSSAPHKALWMKEEKRLLLLL